MIELSREGEVFLLRMDSGENRFTPDFVVRYGECLDEVERADGSKALVNDRNGKVLF